MSLEKKHITCDGNYAASYVAYMFTEVACIYPISPSSPIAEQIDEWSVHDKKNFFGERVRVTELQSEGGAAGALHGALQAGALSSTYTASQGLLLMLPNMYKLAGEFLPAVFHVTARTIATHALSIFGDHSDIYSARQTGFAMISSSSVQEVMDLAGLAHLCAIKGQYPFLHFYDGYRTSHEIQKVEVIDLEKLKSLIDTKALAEFRSRALNPESPVTKGSAQNPDVFFQAREAGNKKLEVIPQIVVDYMDEISKITGRTYKPFMYYGAPDAESIIVAMGSVTETIKEVIDHKLEKGEKVGLITVHLYRPFSTKFLFEVLPTTVKKIAVLDRTKEPGAPSEPLCLDIRNAFYDRELRPVIVGGRYGLSSKDTTPAQIMSVFDNLSMQEPKDNFTIGINDDVTFLSLPPLPEVKITSEKLYEAKFYGIGSDGTVGANKNTIKIIGEATDKYVQAYFDYDSKKSGGYTCSHLRFGDEPIRSTYLVNTPNFVACHVASYLGKFDVLRGMKKGGTFLLNTRHTLEEVKDQIPATVKKQLADNEIRTYIINATKIAKEIGLGNRTNTIMQSAFFKISGIVPFELAVKEMKDAIERSYGRKGEHIVQMNYSAVDAGGTEIEELIIPAEWKSLAQEEQIATLDDKAMPDFVKNLTLPVNKMQGNDLPVSAFLGREDGYMDNGSAAYEKRGIAIDVPQWNDSNCIQCNLCAYVCPHAAIRPFLLNEDEKKNLPKNIDTLTAKGRGLEDLDFRIQVTPLDCTGCGNCVEVCPPEEKALVMKPLEERQEDITNWDYLIENITNKNVGDPRKNPKNAQFSQPLFEFSGACAGCGETPYVKLITQLYGERMILANATGCSSIYGASFPATPYTTNESGRGPAWANSLFEDNAEFGLGITEAVLQKRNSVENIIVKALPSVTDETTKELFNQWLETKEDADTNDPIADQVAEILKGSSESYAKELYALKDYLRKKSIWIMGGDGWAYDIGYGGLDHVLASGANVNVLVLDTEVYSNTGGQASKATPTAALAKFAGSGKKTRKKDLGMMAMSYGHVYVAQVSLSANPNQVVKALREAESYDGPSLTIAYSPCIAHGLKGSLTESSEETKRAVECGYWNSYRYNPDLEGTGKSPFQLDSKEPDFSKFQDFLKNEVRYSALAKLFPDSAEDLLQEAEEAARWRYERYKKLAEK